MSYRVIEKFTDLKDDNHVYNPGDAFPREGAEVSDARLAELSSESNRRGIPLIEKVAGSLYNTPVTPVQPEKAEQEETPKVTTRAGKAKDTKRSTRTKKDNK